jgi:hypothetical protein
MGSIKYFRNKNNFLVKYSASIFVLVLVLGTWGCAHDHHRKTGLLIEGQPTVQKNSNINFVFLDERDDRFKTKKMFLVQHVLPTGTLGDPAYDSSLFDVFQKLVLKRFGDNPQGNKAELKLKAWYPTIKPNEIFIFPILGPLLAPAAKSEFHGILKVEVSILGRDDKYIFHKVYDVDVREMKRPSRATPLPLNLDMINKAFDKFAKEFNQDINRIRFS